MIKDDLLNGLISPNEAVELAKNKKYPGLVSALTLLSVDNGAINRYNSV